MTKYRPAAVAGVELGGCPLASAVALVSFQRGTPIDAIYVRKDAKDHGSRRDLEGNTTVPEGARIVLVEDVITTGGSTLKAVEKLRAAKYEIAGVIALVDREEGGAENIRAANLALTSLYTRADFMPATS
jgi:orotate phosphoribosyltransferase